MTLPLNLTQQLVFEHQPLQTIFELNKPDRLGFAYCCRGFVIGLVAGIYWFY